MIKTLAFASFLYSNNFCSKLQGHIFCRTPCVVDPFFKTPCVVGHFLGHPVLQGHFQDTLCCRAIFQDTLWCRAFFQDTLWCRAIFQDTLWCRAIFQDTLCRRAIFRTPCIVGPFFRTPCVVGPFFRTLCQEGFKKSILSFLIPDAKVIFSVVTHGRPLLKGSVRKNERGVLADSEMNSIFITIILLLSVANLSRKWLITPYTQDNRRSCIIQTNP